MKRQKIGKVPLVTQLEPLEGGYACLAMILAYHRKLVSLGQIKADCGSIKKVPDLDSISQMAVFYGLEAERKAVSFSELCSEDAFPCIVTWDRYRYVVIAGVSRSGKYIVNDLNQMLEEYYQAIISDPKYAKNASKIQKADIWDEDCDGNIVMKFKQKAVIKSIKGTHEVKIPIFDSKGKPLSDIKLGGGSQIKLCFSAAPYYVPSTRMCGLSLRPVAVQVIELKEWAEGGTMQAYGFESEDGYEGAEATEDDDPPFEDFHNDPIPDLSDDDPRTGANQF